MTVSVIRMPLILG